MSGLEITLPCDQDDAMLLAQLQSREPEACACMIKRYAPRLYAQALRLLGDPDEAEGALQRTYIKACEKIASFEGRSELGTWLYRIATNEALMALRRRPRAGTVQVLDEALQASDLPQELTSWSVDPASAMLDEELRAQLERTLLALPDGLRSVFVLREMQGYSTAETAALLGLSEGATKVRLHRARLRLREELADYLGRERREV